MWTIPGHMVKFPQSYFKALNVRTSPCGPICNAKGRICSKMSLGRTQDVNLTIIRKMAFLMELFLFFLIPVVYQTLHCQSKLKTWHDLFWFCYGPGRLDQNRTIRGRPQDVVCHLWNRLFEKLGNTTSASWIEHKSGIPHCKSWHSTL